MIAQLLDKMSPRNLMPKLPLLLFVGLCATRGKSQNDKLHLYLRKSRALRLAGLEKKDHLKDYRSPAGVPTLVPTVAPVAQPTVIPTDAPSLAPTTIAPTTDSEPLCELVESPPMGSNGNTIAGRIGAGFGPSTCGFPLYPGTIGMNQRYYYSEIGPFYNPSPEPTCTTVSIDPGTCVGDTFNTIVHVAAFTEFNPLDIGENYLGDVGARDDFFEFQFFAPGDSKFYVVGQQILDINSPDNGEGCVFSAAVEIGTGNCGFTSPPTMEITSSPTAVPTTGAPSITPQPTLPHPEVCKIVESLPLGSNGNTISGRIGASFGATTCGLSFYPGTIGFEPRYYSEVGPFYNPSPEPACTTVSIDPGTCVSKVNEHTLVHVTAFTEFNPLDIGENYLGDVGVTDDIFEFQFFAPGDSQFYVVGQQILDINSPDNGEGCVFSVAVGIGQGCP